MSSELTVRKTAIVQLHKLAPAKHDRIDTSHQCRLISASVSLPGRFRNNRGLHPLLG